MTGREQGSRAVAGRARYALRLAQIGLEYLSGRTALNGGPLRLFVEPTNVCNLSCPMCLTPRLEQQVPRGLMSPDTFRSVIEAAAPYVRDVFLFLGGEPLLNKQLPEMIRIARAAGLYTRLHTNATLLDERWSIGLLDAGLDFISFSFDGCDENSYREYRVGGDFTRTCANIRQFARLKRQRGSRAPHAVVQLIERPDWSRAERERQRSGLRALFAGAGIDRFKFIGLHNFGGLLEDASFLTGRYFAPCSFLWYTLNVGFDGTVVPCCLDYNRKEPLGNLVSDPMMEVWNGAKLVGLRQKMVARRASEIELCKGCDVPYKKKFLGLPLRNVAGVRELLSAVLQRSPRRPG
jgi:MoaA/NifB/PqqE/SkfB family radical SAM enzyme